MMERQIHLNINELNPRRQMATWATIDCKPRQALWTSDYCHQWGSDWLRYLHERRWVFDYEDVFPIIYEVTPKPTARILSIEDYEQAQIFLRQYSVTGLHLEIDWTPIIEEYDAIRIVPWEEFNAWDCASTAWFTWEAFDFVEVQERGIEESIERLQSIGDDNWSAW